MQKKWDGKGAAASEFRKLGGAARASLTVKKRIGKSVASYAAFPKE
jgi:hypothetical protein